MDGHVYWSSLLPILLAGFVGIVLSIITLVAYVITGWMYLSFSICGTRTILKSTSVTITMVKDIKEDTPQPLLIDPCLPPGL